MGSRKIVMLIGSILIGALAGFALLNYVKGVEEDVLQETQRVDVWVISADVPAGTTAADVQGTNRLEVRKVESQFRPTNAVTDLSQIQGRIAVNNLAANQILVQGMFDDPEAIETTFADLIEEDQIAFSINIASNKAVAGFVEPGDFVDIIHRGTFTPLGEADAFETSADQTPYTTPARFLYRGVRIIGIGSSFVGQDAAPLPGGEEGGSLQITLAVPADAAQKILSVEESDLVLALHPDNWEPESRPNEIPDLILLNDDLPGENPDQITPYGQLGWEDPIEDADEQDADDSSVDATTDAPDTTTEEG